MIELSVPIKLKFLKEQVVGDEIVKKINSQIEQMWGPGYTFSVRLVEKGETGTSAQKVAEDQQKRAEDDVAQKVADHPRVKAMTQALQGQVKSIRDVQTGGKPK